MERKCFCCGRVLISPGSAEHYCGGEDCQRMRKNEWQKRKLLSDAAYKSNKADAQRRWHARHPDYWRNYRANHPDAVDRNREQQRLRNQRRVKNSAGQPLQRTGVIAKMDATSLIKPGTYRLVPLNVPLIAKMDTMIVELSIVSSG